jgi:hypothetical protein
MKRLYVAGGAVLQLLPTDFVLNLPINHGIALGIEMGHREMG